MSCVFHFGFLLISSFLLQRSSTGRCPRYSNQLHEQFTDALCPKLSREENTSYCYKRSNYVLPAYQLFDELRIREQSRRNGAKGKGPAHLGADDPCRPPNAQPPRGAFKSGEWARRSLRRQPSATGAGRRRRRHRWLPPSRQNTTDSRSLSNVFRVALSTDNWATLSSH